MVILWWLCSFFLGEKEKGKGKGKARFSNSQEEMLLKEHVSWISLGLNIRQHESWLRGSLREHSLSRSREPIAFFLKCSSCSAEITTADDGANQFFLGGLTYSGSRKTLAAVLQENGMPASGYITRVPKLKSWQKWATLSNRGFWNSWTSMMKCTSSMLMGAQNGDLVVFPMVIYWCVSSFFYCDWWWFNCDLVVFFYRDLMVI